MRRGRLLILVGVLLLLGTVAIFLVVGRVLPQPTEEPAGGIPEAEATPVPANTVDIAVAGQDFLRGATISTDALQMWPWPEDLVPTGAIFDLEEAVGKKARTDILRGEPVLETMVVATVADLAGDGSYAALSIPEGMVGIALPINRFSGVAQAILPGDWVDVILTLLFVDLDEDMQSRTPSQTARVIAPSVDPDTGEEVLTLTIINQGEGSEYGLAQQDPGLGEQVFLVPSEAQRPRMVTQLIVQNAMVLHVGEYTEADRLGPQAEVTPTPEAEPVGQPEEQATPPPPPPPRDIVTLVVTRQDALVLQYVMHAYWNGSADFSLALRSAGDATEAISDPVTLQYLIEHFNIAVPARQPYGLEPRQDQIPTGAESSVAPGE